MKKIFKLEIFRDFYVNPNNTIFPDNLHTNNGMYTFFSDNLDKINNVKDLISLDFLSKLAFQTYLCVCKNPINFSLWLKFPENKKCKFCNQKTDFNKLRKTYEGRQQLKQQNQWKLEFKYFYKFLIDIYDSNQTGCEIEIRLLDLENGKLFEEYNLAKKTKPDFLYKIHEYNLKCEELNILMYKSKEESRVYFINYNEIFDCFYDKNSSILDFFEY